MSFPISILLVSCLSVISAFGAQQSESQRKRKAVIMPSEYALAVVAQQPDCPLQFEKAQVTLSLDRVVGYDIQLRNRGTKPIRDFTFAALNSVGTGGRWGFPSKTPDEWIMPGQTAPRAQADSEYEIIPLTDTVREELNLSETMKTVVVFMVVRVEFADGSVYSFEPTYKSLRAYFENL